MPRRRHWYHSPVAKAAVVCVLAFPLVRINIQRRENHFGAGQSIYGLFDVTRFVRNGQVTLPLAVDGAAWKRVASDRSNSLCIQFANADVRRFQFTDDMLHHVWTIRDTDAAQLATLNYAVRQDGAVFLNGRIGNDSVELLLRPLDLHRFFPLLGHAGVIP